MVTGEAYRHLGDVSHKWLALAERRCEFFAELWRTGRWKLYCSEEEQFALRMREVFDMVARVARSDTAAVLITGERGTGKEVVARAIHDHSPRASGPFRPLNCAAIANHLIERELFGFERYAFTDAKKQKRGLLELAVGGTLFLDEIGEMPLDMQT